MSRFDWHAGRAEVHDLALIDRAPESEGIHLADVRRYRLGRVREEMARHDVDALVLSDPVNGARCAPRRRAWPSCARRCAPASPRPGSGRCCTGR